MWTVSISPPARASPSRSRTRSISSTRFVPNCYITPIIADWPQIRTIIHPNIQNAVFGKITAEQAMNNPAKEINDILAKKK